MTSNKISLSRHNNYKYVTKASVGLFFAISLLYVNVLPVKSQNQSAQGSVSAHVNSGLLASGVFPSTVIIDDFNRSNGGVGSNWSGDTSGYAIVSNRLDVGLSEDIYWNASLFGVDQEAFVTFTTIDQTSPELGIILKAQTYSGYGPGMIDVIYSPVGHYIQVWTYYLNGWTKHGLDIPAVFVNGDQFGVRANANGDVEIYQNGNLLGVINISSWPYHAYGGYIGLLNIGAGNAVLDNFGGGTISSSPTLTPTPVPCTDGLNCNPVSAVPAYWRCNIPECSGGDWVGTVINWPSWAAYESNGRSGNNSRTVYSAVSGGNVLYPYMGSWADGCEVTAISGIVLIIEWERGTDIWRETYLSPGQSHTINLISPEDGVLLESPNDLTIFTVSLSNCTPQNIYGTTTPTATPNIPTATITAVNTPTHTATITYTPTNTATSTATYTPTNTPVPPTATHTATSTSTYTATSTATKTATNTPVPPTATHTATSTPTYIATGTATHTPTNTATNTPVPLTATHTATSTPTYTATGTATHTPTNTATNTPVPPTAAHTATSTPTNTATSTVTYTPTNTSVPPTATHTATSTPTYTATSTATKTATNTSVPPTATHTASSTPTNTATSTATHTPTNTTTNTPVPPTATHTASSTPTNTATSTATYTPTNTATNTPVPPTATSTSTSTVPTSTLHPDVISHSRDHSIPLATPNGSATGMSQVLDNPAQQGQSAVVPIFTLMPAPVLLTDTPMPLTIKAANPTLTPEPVFVVNPEDITAPETTLLAAPGSNSRQRSAFFAHGSTKAGTFVCSLDGSAYFACDSSIRFTGLGEGMHLFQVRAVDEFGNYDATPAIYTWMIKRNVDIQRYKTFRK